jgi:hypothetical protein
MIDIINAIRRKCWDILCPMSWKEKEISQRAIISAVVRVLSTISVQMA